MTITTASPARLPRLLPLAAALMTLLAPSASGASWDVVPALTVRETWTDNVALQPGDLAQRQLVSELSPSLAVMHNSPRLKLSSIVRLRHYEFSDEKVSGTARNQREGSAGAQGTLVDDLLYFNASANRAQRSVSPFGVVYREAAYAEQNQAAVTSYSISPYLVHRFGSSASLQLRLARDAVNSDNPGFGDTKSNNVLLNLNSGSAFRTIGWGLNYNRQDLEDSRSGSILTQSAVASLRYRASATLSLTATGGYDEYDYTSLGGVTKGPSWTGGFIWTPSSRTSLEASGGKRYVGTTKSLKAVHRSRRTVWNIIYNDAVTNSRSNFLLPATFDTASLLDRMFQADIADPAQRQLAVAEYMRRTGLPATLAESINFFSNRFFLQKSFNGSVALKGARSMLVFTAYRTRRDALSVRESDSQLLGNSSSSINDNTVQRGTNASFTYTVSPRTSLLLSSDAYRSESLSTSFSSFNRAQRLIGNHRFGKYLTGTLEMRHIKGTSAFVNNQPYRENAIAASLTYTR